MSDTARPAGAGASPDAAAPTATAGEDSALSPRTRRRLRVALDGLVAVHAVRAAWTAMAAVPGVVEAEVDRHGATVHVDADLPAAAWHGRIAEALQPVGIGVRSVEAIATRWLPLA